MVAIWYYIDVIYVYGLIRVSVSSLCLFRILSVYCFYPSVDDFLSLSLSLFLFYNISKLLDAINVRLFNILHNFYLEGLSYSYIWSMFYENVFILFCFFIY